MLDKATEYADGGAGVAEAMGHLPASCPSPYVGEYPTDGGADPWGGHENGRIPRDQMCSIGGGRLLRCDAAEAFNAMNAAHLAERGYAIPVTDSYRSYTAQVDVHRRKPHLAATPGTSNGWHHPPWARIDGSKPEEWHWEYGGSG